MSVLVVEDHAEPADTVTWVLRREVMAVDVAYDGRDATDRATVVDNDVVLLDRDIPRYMATRCVARWSSRPRRAGC
jgi:DNA-binding response OmpR family regulator